MGRFHELEALRRSLAMYPPGSSSGLDREDAMKLLAELQDLDRRLRELQEGLARLLVASEG